MTVVITGANGFIGRRLATRCLVAGLDVVAIVRPGSDYAVDDRIQIVECDLSSLKVLPRLVGHAETFYHLAWMGTASETHGVPSEQLPNLATSFDVVDAAADLGVKRLICPGSMSELAHAEGLATGFEDPSPVDVYAAAKVSARQLMGVWSARRDVGFIWTFITSVYGPGRVGANIITYTIQCLLRGQQPAFSGLEQQWDFIYIDDLVEALFLLGHSGVPGRRYPIGSGRSMPIRRYVEQIRDAIDPSASLGIGVHPYRSKRLDNSTPDISALERDTGFVASTPFSVGVAATISHLRENQCWG